jgi:hypothetical protein
MLSSLSLQVDMVSSMGHYYHRPFTRATVDAIAGDTAFACDYFNGLFSDPSSFTLVFVGAGTN